MGRKLDLYKNKFMILSDWILIDEYCYCRVLDGTDPMQVKNRVAFIEKTPRVRINSYTDIDTDFKNWKEVGFGTSDRGKDENSRKMCDDYLKTLGYKFSK